MSNQVVAINSITEVLQARPALTRLRSPQALALENYECFTGVSTHVSELKQFISVQATSDQPALLIGERGLRQEQIARVLHQASEEWEAPFIGINVHSLSDEALHELLFGTQGLLAKCQRGVIFINELAGLPLLLQQRFAVHIEEQRWRHHAKTLPRPRLVFATEFNQAELSAENRIAFGLIELLRAWSFRLKSLRQRSEDIPYLARHLTDAIAGRSNRGPHEISERAMHVLSEYHWEGNIDELEAVLESAIARTGPHEIEADLLPARIRLASLKNIPPEGLDLAQLVDDYERSLIEAALDQTSGQQARAARLLGLRVQTLNMKLKRLGMQKKQTASRLCDDESQEEE